MEKFIVEVCKGLVTNKRKGTSRRGYWIPLKNIPHYIAEQLACVKNTARPTLSWDTHKAQWRDMRNAKIESFVIANAVLVTMPDGSKGITLLDF